MNCTNDSRVKVLYIAGASRSGSTILDNILGEIDGFFSAGEIRFLWQRVLEGRLCGCGLPINECAVWSRVIRSFLDEPPLGGLSAEDVIDWQARSAKLKHTFGLLRRDRPDESSDVTSLLTALESVYTSLAEVTSARVIVDSSKRASGGALLRFLPSVQPFFLHLVRDPRAMAYSQRHRKANPDGGAEGELASAGPAMSGTYWNVSNLMAEALCRREPARSMRLRYEDFVRQPIAAIEKIVAMLGESSARLPFVDNRRVELGVNHAVSGNPSRFQRGPRGVKLDDRWVTEMSRSDRRLTTALVWPLMLRYGYPLVPRRR